MIVVYSIHDLPPEVMSPAAEHSDYVRVQVLTPAGVLADIAAGARAALSAGD